MELDVEPVAAELKGAPERCEELEVLPPSDGLLAPGIEPVIPPPIILELLRLLALPPTGEDIEELELLDRDRSCPVVG